MSNTHPLREWRDRENLSQTALAKKLRIAPSHVSMIETRQKTPSLDLAVKLSKLTEIPVERFCRAGAR